MTVASLFRDRATGEIWRESHLYSEYHGGGIRYLIQVPEPSPLSLIEMAVSSPDPGEAELAARILVLDPEQRSSLIHRLEKFADAATSSREWERVRLIIEWASLRQRANLRSAHGKTPSEVREDYAYFESLAQNAQDLKARADRALR
jgi:hypothetical protein